MGETSLWSKLQELLGCFGPTDLGLLGLTISPFGAGCERARAPLGSAPGEGSQPSGACFVLLVSYFLPSSYVALISSLCLSLLHLIVLHVYLQPTLNPFWSKMGVKKK